MIYLHFSLKLNAIKKQTCFAKKNSPKVNVALGESFICFKNFLPIYRVVKSLIFPFSWVSFFFIIIFFFVVSHTAPLFMCAKIWRAKEKFNVVIIFEFISFHKSLPSRIYVFIFIFRFLLGVFFYIILLEGYSREFISNSSSSWIIINVIKS